MKARGVSAALAVSFLSLSALALGLARDAKGPAVRGRVLAWVDGAPIGEADARDLAVARAQPRPFGAEEQGARVSLAPSREPSPAEVRAALDQLVDEAALVAEARRRGYERDPTISRRLIMRLLEEEVDASIGEVCECGGGHPEKKPEAETAALKAALVQRARATAGTWIAPDAAKTLASVAKN